MSTHVHVRSAPSSARAGQSHTRWLALAVLCVTLLMVNLDNTVLNVALPTLVRDLHATTTELQWIVDAYILVFAGLLLAGSLADRVGRKKVFCSGLLAFAAGSAWAAFSGVRNCLRKQHREHRARRARCSRFSWGAHSAPMGGRMAVRALLRGI